MDFYLTVFSSDFNRQFEIIIPAEDSVITEMTSTLRDWGTMWKQLYVVNKSLFFNRQYTVFVYTVLLFGNMFTILQNRTCNRRKQCNLIYVERETYANIFCVERETYNIKRKHNNGNGQAL